MASEVLINLKEHSICISFDNSSRLYYFDKLGRLIGAYVEGRNFKRSLDGGLHQQWGILKNGIRQRRRRVLLGREKRTFFEQMSQAITPVYYALLKGSDAGIQITAARQIDARRDAAIRWLKRIVGFDKAARKRDQSIFRSIYKPVSVLPPDQYLSVVLQATEGCAYNQCTFCDFFKDREFRIKSGTEFGEHIKAVKGFFGESIILRKSIFLADANALTSPQAELLQIFELVNAAFDFIPPQNDMDLKAWKVAHPFHFNGIYSFVDAFSTRQKSPSDFAALRRLNLKRVYIGVETGVDELLRFLRKPGTPELMRYAVNAIKAGGVNVGVILMIGVGGENYFDVHVRDTLALIHEMDLSEGDIIYLSEFVEHPGLEYSRKAAEAGITPLTPERMHAQMQEMKKTFRALGKSGTPQVSTYDIREFIY